MVVERAAHGGAVEADEQLAHTREPLPEPGAECLEVGDHAVVEEAFERADDLDPLHVELVRDLGHDLAAQRRTRRQQHERARQRLAHLDLRVAPRGVAE